MICNSCNLPIVMGELVIACKGFCSGFFHAKCVGLSSDEKVSCLRNPHIFWICTTCSTILREIRNSEDIQAKLKLRVDSPDLQRLTEEDSSARNACKPSDVIAEMRTEIAAIQKTLADLTASRLSVLSTTTDEQPLAHSSPTPISNATEEYRLGNRTGVIPRQMSTGSTKCTDKFWLFFSRVQNDASEDEIRSMVTDCLGCTETIIVQKLVSKWTDTRQLPYISFKVGIDKNYRDRAMNSSTWPNGVCFREFRENRYTWNPQLR